MSQEQRDSYVIPPNFIEGGSFFGGLFKARNVVEAVILAAGTGLPILTLSLTLTVRIILLCLTSLPLALLALIGSRGCRFPPISFSFSLSAQPQNPKQKRRQKQPEAGDPPDMG